MNKVNFFIGLAGTSPCKQFGVYQKSYDCGRDREVLKQFSRKGRKIEIALFCTFSANGFFFLYT
jgi:hypothetical protein